MMVVVLVVVVVVVVVAWPLFFLHICEVCYSCGCSWLNMCTHANGQEFTFN